MPFEPQIEQAIAPVREKPYACDFFGCTKRFNRRSDATRHYEHKHNPDLHAHCPVCLKMISDARKDKQKEHMTKRHPYAASINQAWIRVEVSQHTLGAPPVTPARHLTSSTAAGNGAAGTFLHPFAICGTFNGQWSPAALEGKIMSEYSSVKLLDNEF